MRHRENLYQIDLLNGRENPGDDFDCAAVLEALTMNAQNVARAAETPVPKGSPGSLLAKIIGNF